jgi:hypothetical protein
MFFDQFLQQFLAPKAPETGPVVEDVDALVGPCAKRQRMDPEQHSFLLKAFTDCPRPDSNQRKHLAQVTGLSSRAIQIWFQNRRAKLKKETKDPELFGMRSEGGASHGFQSSGESKAASPSPKMNCASPKMSRIAIPPEPKTAPEDPFILELFEELFPLVIENGARNKI